MSAIPPAGYPAVLAVREFRAVFGAHLLSLLGIVVGEIALSVLVYRLTGSPAMSALAFALGFLPYVAGGTLLSGVADRYPARRVLVVCDLLCAASAAGMALPGTPVAALLALRCVNAAIGPVFAGTRAATLGDVLGEGDLFVLGRSLIRLVSQGAQLAGFAAGGLLLTAVSPRGALLATVAGFLASATLLRFGTRARPARAVGGGLLTSSLSGVGRLLARPRTRALLLLSWLPPFFLVVPEALAAPYADDLGAGPAGLGLLMCAMPVGAIAGEVLAGSLLGPRARERITLPVAAGCLLPFLGYAAHPSLGWALLAVGTAGLGMAHTLGLDQWFLAAVPEELRGRAMTVQTAGTMTIQGLGMACAGLVAEGVPVHVVVAAAGVIGTLAVGAVVRLVVRSAASRSTVRPAGGVSHVQAAQEQ
ncbi:MFS transporter [Streptomyces eurocidicus]|uniref:MFS family permease n=1 Tax=Streptomyces eurocidicus TaxID=66423 RepID=A0A2N8NQW2_STREU|nr:MFS transporter [Streptomyces eurocidicus]MBB5116920.1 MFS family permease [Streptomyces eurocidicus]MBF6052776.1 MFS transporter [Streptomyces eurocidicus]PNE31159.1 MFS transporter [Streptomyces eurocidicus]